jgi:[amino group carrier protein]-6-phospho-L-2-aminoadipate/5-phospho-L-glutamate reductase
MTRIGIIGGSGFAGGSLIQLLCFHPDIELTFISSRKWVGKFIHTQIPILRGISKLKFELPKIENIAEKCDLVFTAVPHKTAQEIVPNLVDHGLKVIDLSADFRLRKIEPYNEYYGEHSHPEMLKEAVYGMPELHRDEIKNAKLVAVPGCQAASAIYALAPLIKNNMIDPLKIIVDSKTGSSGSGAIATESSHHPIRANSIRPYKLTGHRHTAEIEQELGNLANGTDVKIGFSAHAVNLTRGILGTAYTFPLNDKMPEERDIIKAYRTFYRGEKFVRFMRLATGVFRLPDPKLIAGSNYADVSFEIDTHINRIVSLCALDNLIKGTAGNAIQSMNIMLGLKEETALEFPGLYPY